MKTIVLSDQTMKAAAAGGNALSFKKKLDLAKRLDRLNIGVIETERAGAGHSDGLLIRSLADCAKNAVLAVPVDPNEPESFPAVWEAAKNADKPRLQAELPVSTVQMEYFYHKKPEGMLKLIETTVSALAALCPEVEFIAADAGRAEPGFLKTAVETAVRAGAKIVTVCDAAGSLLPDEFAKQVAVIKDVLGDSVKLGVSVSNALYLADADSVAAVAAGADEVKVLAYGSSIASLERVAAILAARGESIGVSETVRLTELSHGVSEIAQMIGTVRTETTPFDGVHGVPADDTVLTVHDDCAAVTAAAARLGYALDAEDAARVYEAFSRVAVKREQVGIRELDAIIAAAAMQVPPTYRIESYLINSGNVITATAHIRLVRDGKVLEGLSVGDGPVDAAFLAIEQILGCRFELDDFELRSVTEGREAMGEAIVRLISRGKVYSGRGISTDIIGSSINAYINAVNKIVYEEAEG